MPNSHVCPHEAHIKQDHKELFGNGKDGLVKDFTALQTEFMGVKDDIEKLATSYSALAKSEIKKDAIEQAKLDLEQKKVDNSRRRSSAAKFVGTVVSIVSGVVILVIKILDHIGT